MEGLLLDLIFIIFDQLGPSDLLNWAFCNRACLELVSAYVEFVLEPRLLRNYDVIEFSEKRNAFHFPVLHKDFLLKKLVGRISRTWNSYKIEKSYDVNLLLDFLLTNEDLTHGTGRELQKGFYLSLYRHKRDPSVVFVCPPSLSVNCVERGVPLHCPALVKIDCASGEPPSRVERKDVEESLEFLRWTRGKGVLEWYDSRKENKIISWMGMEMILYVLGPE